MKIALKLLTAALLSLTIGIACASPLLISELTIKPYPRIPDGPKADTSVSVIYANFIISAGNTALNNISTSILDYEVVLNVTNLSDLGNKVTRLGLTVAQDIAAVPAAVGFLESLGGANSTTGGYSGGGTMQTATSDDLVKGTRWSQWSEYSDGQRRAGGSGLVTGVWLDGKWTNVTWVPGTDYPKWPEREAISTTPPHMPSHSETWPTLKTVPPLPEIATTEGTWVEGVPIIEMHNITTAQGKTTGITTATAIFINGTWVDVTGRVRTANEQLYIRATNTIAAEIHYFGTEPPISLTQSLSSGTLPLGTTAYAPVTTYTKSGDGQFNDYWAPHQSRLILLKGTREILPNWGLDSLATGKIWLLAEQFNQVQDPNVNSTALYTYSGSHWLNQVQLQQTTNGYLYNTLGENQMFVSDQFSVEIFIKPRS